MAASETARVRLAHRVDEAKDIRDKALALATYARQAKDVELQAWVTEIRLRAERRTGELLRETKKSAGARGTGSNQHRKVESSSNDATSLKSLGITRDQSSNWKKLASPRTDPQKSSFRAGLVSGVGRPRFSSGAPSPAVVPPAPSRVATRRKPTYEVPNEDVRR
jgi:hypothetical protein